MTAGRQVENFTFLVADKGIVGTARRGRATGRGRARAPAYTAPAGQGQRRAVGREDNTTACIRAVHGNARRGKVIKRRCSRVSVGILPYADNAVFRR